MNHELREKILRFNHRGEEQWEWVFALNFYTQEEFQEFLAWAYDMYGMEAQYATLFTVNIGYDGDGASSSVQYFVTTHLNDDQAMKWKLRWGSGHANQK